MSQITSNIEMMINSIRKISVQLKRDAEKISAMDISLKKVYEFVQNTNFKIKETLYRSLSFYTKYDFVLDEEEESEEGSEGEYRYIVNSLDGLINFTRGIPNFAISMVLEHIQSKEIIASVIYLPTTDEAFCAEKNKGSFVVSKDSTQRRLLVSHETENILGSILKIKNLNDTFLNVFNFLVSKNIKMRLSGSISTDLAYVASGKYDVAVFIGPSLRSILAGKLLVEESGGAIIYRENEYLIAGNNQILGGEISKILENNPMEEQ